VANVVRSRFFYKKSRLPQRRSEEGEVPIELVRERWRLRCASARRFPELLMCAARSPRRSRTGADGTSLVCPLLMAGSTRALLNDGSDGATATARQVMQPRNSFDAKGCGKMPPRTCRYAAPQQRTLRDRHGHHTGAVPRARPPAVP